MSALKFPQSICRFGIARCEVTPPVGIYHRMWGAAMHDRATGVHRPLTATALVLRPSEQADRAGEEFVLVALDHCLLWSKEMGTLLQKVCSHTGMDRRSLVVTFSHTHAAGLMGLERVHLPGGDLIPHYLERLAAQVADIVCQARSNTQPATIAYGTGRCDLAAHRDFWDEQSRQFVCGFNPSGPSDDTVMVARVTDAADRVMATLVNYACHPTTLAWENTLISPDYPGAMRELVEVATGAPCVFLQGSSGDLGPRHGYVGDSGVADRNGRQLGYAVLAALESLAPPRKRFEYMGPVLSGATIGSWSYVPIGAEDERRLSRWRLDQWLVELPYKPDLPDLDTARAELRRRQYEEAAAQARQDPVAARECRALAERMTRLVNRLADLPAGDSFPLPVWLLRIGDACWIAVEGEHYHLLQSSLRERFHPRPILVSTVANGARPAYLPTREAYGKGIYQESIAVLAAGSLEQLRDEISARMQTVFECD